ncbi:unnamed protein product [Lota lota]
MGRLDAWQTTRQAPDIWCASQETNGEKHFSSKSPGGSCLVAKEPAAAVCRALDVERAGSTPASSTTTSQQEANTETTQRRDTSATLEMAPCLSS